MASTFKVHLFNNTKKPYMQFPVPFFQTYLLGVKKEFAVAPPSIIRLNIILLTFPLWIIYKNDLQTYSTKFVNRYWNQGSLIFISKSLVNLERLILRNFLSKHLYLICKLFELNVTLFPLSFFSMHPYFSWRTFIEALQRGYMYPYTA